VYNGPVLNSYEARFIQTFPQEQDKNISSWAIQFDISIYWQRFYIKNNQFHSYIDWIYSNDLEINDTTKCSISALYLHILLKVDTDGKVTDQLYDKGHDFNFYIVIFPYMCCNNEYHSPVAKYIVTCLKIQILIELTREKSKFYKLIAKWKNVSLMHSFIFFIGSFSFHILFLGFQTFFLPEYHWWYFINWSKYTSGASKLVSISFTFHLYNS
jgi:hypothetical protein